MKNNYIKSERMWNVCLTYVYRMFYVISILFTIGIGDTWGKYIYLNLNSWTSWENQGDGVDPYFRVTFWKDGTSDTNYSLTSIGNHLYRADIGNESRTSMTFKRMKTNTETQWNYANMTIDGEKNVCVISGWDDSGAWGSYKISRVQGGYIYFDNSVTQWSGTIQFVIGHDDYGSGKYSRTYTMSQITGTQIWYVNLSDQSNHTWNDATYFAFIATDGKWDDNGWGSDNISNATNYTGIYSSPFDLNDGSTYMCTPSAAANGSSFSITYKSSGYSAIASTYTHNLYVYTRTQLDGSTPSYGTSLNSPTTVNIKGYQMTGNGASTQQTSSVTTSSMSTTRGSIISTSTVSSDYTALDANSAWTFDGWAVNTGGPSNTNSTYSITNAKAAKSIYAYFSKRTYTVSFNMHGYGDAVSDQVKDYYALVAQPSTPTTSSAYVFRGWWKESTYVNQWNFSSDHVTTTTTLHAKWLAYVNVAYNKGANGTGSNVTDKKVTGENLTLRGAIFTRTGYTQTGWSTTDGGAKAYNLSATYSTQSALNLYPFWTVNTYNITLNAGTGGSGSGSATVDYDATAYKTFTHDITQTGYHIEGWYDNSASLKVLNPNGSFAASNVTGYITSGQWTKAADCTLQAWWDPNNYIVTLDKQSSAPGHSSDGDVSNQSVYYNTALPSISGTAPTAINGWAFMGFYTATGGEGVQVIDANLNWVASVDGYTDADSKWKHADNVTLYAYYKQAEITGITFSTAGVPGSVIAPSTSTTATATISPTPTGTTTICWRILHSNGNPLEEQPTFDPETGAAVSFTTSATSGSYLIEARLRLGSGCSGTVLDSVTSVFQVAGDHNVTVQYKDANGNTIKASEIVTGRPLAWSSAIEAPEIFGYTFSQWEAVDGVTISTDGTNPIVGSTTSTRTIYIKAVYDGRIVAKYNKKDFIYFKNTLGWDNNSVYVYFYKDGGYWDDSKGAGATGDACIGKGKMSLVDGETDILYWDYGAGITGGAAAATKYIAFTAGNGTGHENFNGFDVVYPYNGNLGHQGFNAGTPMFVPLEKGVQPNPNYTKNGSTPYFDRGYWTKYNGGTGYSIDIFFSKGGGYDKSVNFVAGATPDMPYTATVDLSGGTTLGFKIHRANSIYYYTTTDVTMSNATTAKDLTFDSGATNQTGITTTAAGDYVFTLTCAASGELQISVKYPVAAGDYRVLYKDDVHTGWKPSAVVPKVNNGKDTVSFFIRPGSTPEMKIQQASIDGSTLTWNDYSTISDWVDNAGTNALSKDSVYNICLTMNGSGGISVGNVEAYTGNFYIRTDAANNKWDNYKAADHMMTYSEYSEHNSDFSHYWMAHVTATSSNTFNVKYVVANDYSPCISDTLIQSTYRGGDSDHVNESGYISTEANIRFMWKRSTNEVYRAYLAPAQSDGSKFLVLRGQTDDNLLDVDENALRNASNNNHLGGDYCMQFVDNENWIYETTVKVIPSSYVKLFALFDEENFYYKGANNNTFNGSDSGDGYHTPNAIQLITGSGEAQLVRVIYDFKTDRLVAAYLPSGNITENMDINADVMFIREHQGDIDQLTFNDGKALTDVKTAYAVMRFNKWTLNNKSKAAGHAPLATPLSRYERDLFYISFPFRVNLNEVFGFGTYGVHWILEYYDGAGRAEKGFWKDSPTFWKFVTNRNGFILEPNVGYLLALDLDQLGEESAVWNNRVENVELFFPSTGNIGSITTTSVTHELPAHTCTINRPTPQGDRRVADSHWNIMSVPTYVNVNNPSFTNTTWTATIGPKFLYTWNADDNTLTPTTAAGFNYHAMHAYTVQYYGNVTWTASTTSPIVARKLQEPSAYEWCLELQQNDKMIDRTYVRMSDEEEVTTGFEFGYDMSKSIEWAKANIYTFIGTEWVAGNSLPLETEQTTIIPVGLTLAAAGDYTFAMPAGTHGVGVTLVDTQTNERTNLSAGMTQTVTLTQGDHLDRFFLEISPILNTPTDIEAVTGDGLPANGARKVLIDGILYIVKGDKLYDVRGTMIK